MTKCQNKLQTVSVALLKLENLILFRYSRLDIYTLARDTLQESVARGLLKHELHGYVFPVTSSSNTGGRGAGVARIDINFFGGVGVSSGCGTDCRNGGSWGSTVKNVGSRVISKPHI